MKSFINATELKSSPQARAADLCRRVIGDRSVRETFFIFAFTRVFVFVIFVAVGNGTLISDSKPDDHDLDVTLSMEKAQVVRQLRQTLIRGDAGWYLTIAEKGYERRPFDAQSPHNWAFFPLYPMLMYLAGAVTGEYLIGGALLSNLFFLLLSFCCINSSANRALTRRRLTALFFIWRCFPSAIFFRCR